MEREPFIRLGVFLGVFVAMALWESSAPRRRLIQGRGRRWAVNWAIAILDSLTVRVLFPLAAVGAALDAGAHGWGVLNALSAPSWLSILATVLLFDMLVWAQHVAFHKAPVLWRLHRVHHADRDVDVTTAIRFHPIEIALSMLLKIGAVYVLGAPAVGVLAFEVLLNGCAMFNHSNIRLSPRVDAALRLILVTPDMHRVHHSADRAEHDTNYGFCLSWWDRLFRVYTERPALGQDDMTLGLASAQDDRPARLGWALLSPFYRLR